MIELIDVSEWIARLSKLHFAVKGLVASIMPADSSIIILKSRSRVDI